MGGGRYLRADEAVGNPSRDRGTRSARRRRGPACRRRVPCRRAAAFPRPGRGDDRLRLERRERGAGDRRLDAADDRDLPRRAQPQVDAAQHPGEETRSAPERGLREPEHAEDRLPLELLVSPDPPEPAGGRGRASSCPTGSACPGDPSCAPTRASPSAGERKKPPCSSSAKSSTASSARRRASTSQRTSPVATCSSMQPVGDVCVVVEKSRGR